MSTVAESGSPKKSPAPPSVTVKDYTWGGSAGYLSPQRDGTAERFPSIIQIVPALPAPPR